jgi:hypothetical protein
MWIRRLTLPGVQDRGKALPNIVKLEAKQWFEFSLHILFYAVLVALAGEIQSRQLGGKKQLNFFHARSLARNQQAVCECSRLRTYSLIYGNP